MILPGLNDLDLAAVSLESLLGVGYLIVFGSLVGFASYVWLLRSTSTSLVSTYAYVNPIVAVFLGWAVLGEAVTGRTLLGGAIIVTAVALIVSARPAQKPAEEPNPASREDQRVSA
jgi:drug/metabolite transporter (DMT)-like permease